MHACIELLHGIYNIIHVYTHIGIHSVHLYEKFVVPLYYIAYPLFTGNLLSNSQNSLIYLGSRLE